MFSKYLSNNKKVEGKFCSKQIFERNSFLFGCMGVWGFRLGKNGLSTSKRPQKLKKVKNEFL